MSILEVQKIFGDFVTNKNTPDQAQARLQAIDPTTVPPADFGVFMDNYLKLQQAVQTALVGQMGSTNFERIINSITSVTQLLGNFQTDEYDNEKAETIRKAIRRRTKELLDADMPLPPIGDPNRIKVEKNREDVRKLVDTVTDLTEWQIFHAKTVDARNITLRSVELLVGNGTPKTPADKRMGSLEKSHERGSALGSWTEFLQNDLVKGGGEDQHQYKPDMGVITAINCVMFQLMRTKLDGRSGRSKYPHPGYNGRWQTFDRAADYYKNGQSLDLVNYICDPTNGPFVVYDADEKPHTIDIQALLKPFSTSTGVIEIIKSAALLSASAKNLGRDAADYIQGRFFNSPKLGSGDSETGWTFHILGRYLYKALACGSREAPFETMAFFNPFYIEGGPFKLNGGLPSSSEPGNLALETYADAAHRAKLSMESVIFWYRPKTPSDKITASYEFRPTRWFHDFPPPSDLLSRLDGTQPSTYKDAEKAFHYIETQAYQAPTLAPQGDVNQMTQYVSKVLGDLFTQYAIVIGYMGPGTNSADRYYMHHQYIRSMIKWTLMWLFFNTPGEIVSKGDSLHFSLTSLGTSSPNRDYVQRTQNLKSVIINQVRNYRSIGNIDINDPDNDIAKSNRSLAFEIAGFLDEPYLCAAEYMPATEKQTVFNLKRLVAEGRLVEVNGKYSRFKTDPSGKKIELISEKEYEREMAKYFSLCFVTSKDSTPDKG